MPSCQGLEFFSPLKLSRGRCAETRLGAQIFEPIWHAYLHGPKILKHPCAKFQSQDVSRVSKAGVPITSYQIFLSWGIPTSHGSSLDLTSWIPRHHLELASQPVDHERAASHPRCLQWVACYVGCSYLLLHCAWIWQFACSLSGSSRILVLLDGVHQHSPAMDRRDSAWR
jgi:hypothetical protein